MLIRASLTDCGFGSFGLRRSLRWRIPLLPLSESKSRAALHLPENIKFAKERAVFLPLGGLFLGSLSWMAFPSSIIVGQCHLSSRVTIFCQGRQCDLCFLMFGVVSEEDVGVQWLPLGLQTQGWMQSQKPDTVVIIH